MNWEMIGHEWAVELLSTHIVRGETRHAYLFTGATGVGRRTLAIRLIQALNCPNTDKTGSPCRACRLCLQIEKMQQADLLVVQAEKEGGTLKVDQIRELQHNLSLTPYEAKYKAALLLRFEEAHPSAMNALLKTLEEPPAQVVLLLTADSPESLLPTIVSRCEVIRLRPSSLEQLEAGLRARFQLSPQDSRLLAQISGGRPGAAIRLAQSPALLEERTEWLNELKRLLAARYGERFDYADGFTKEKDKEKMRAELRAKLALWLSFWRDMLLVTAGASAPISNLDWGDSIQRASTELGVQSVSDTIHSIERSITLLEENVNPRLVAEALMLDLPRVVI